MSYLNLHAHSVYSKKDALSEPIDIALKNKELGNDAFCITDHGDLGAWIKAYEAQKEAGLQFIPGCEFYMVPEAEYWSWNVNNNDEVETKEETCKYHHIIAIAINQTGVKNLIRIYNKHSERYGRPCITRDDLFENSEGLIVTNACVVGEIPFYLSIGELDKAREIMKLYKEHFGERYYTELQFHGLTLDKRSEKDIYRDLVNLSRELDVKMIFTNDSHYTNKEDKIDHSIYKTIHYGKTRNEDGSFPGEFDGEGYHILTEEEAKNYLNNLDFLTEEEKNSCFININEIRNMCEETHFPQAQPLTDKTEELRELVWKGFEEKRKGTELEEQSRERIEVELETIENMKFTEYFTNVYNIVKRANDLDLIVGGGRGCFLPGTTVSLNDCKKNIEDVEIGDLALTRSGGYKPVVGLHKYDINEECVELRLSNGKTIKCTLDHRILVCDKWVEAKDIAIGDELFVPKVVGEVRYD